MEEDIYVPAHAGDILTASNWTKLQMLIKQDIQRQVQAAKDELTKNGVERADNADKFDQKTPKGWTDVLDQRYAPKVHDHEGMAAYRRYIKEFTADLDKVLLRHELGRFPLVDVYVLESVPGTNYTPPSGQKDLRGTKLLVYYGDEDADDLDVLIRVYRDKPEFLGVALPKMLDELQVKYNDQNTLDDVISDMWEALFVDPNDEIAHGVTPWVRDAYSHNRTVRSLREGGEWDNMRVGIRAQRIGTELGDQNVQVQVSQINYRTIMIEARPQPTETRDQKLDLMILLRS